MGGNPGLTAGKVPTSAEWNSYFSAKQDDLGYTPLSTSGGTLTGPLTLTPSTATAAGINVAVGATPVTPNNGDMWSTVSGLFVHISGSTVPLTGGAVTSFSGGTLTGKLFTVASTTALSGINVTPGAVPLSPINGDIWVTSSGLFAQINSTTLNVSQPSQLHSLTLKGSPLQADELLCYDTAGAQLVKVTVGSVGPSNVIKSNTTATITAGYTVTPNNGGTVTSGTFTPNPASSNYQYYTNNGAHTLAAPSSDCAIDILITNGASAGTITFSGFTVSSNTGDALTTTNTNMFLVSVRRINGISTYVTKALQ